MQSQKRKAGLSLKIARQGREDDVTGEGLRESQATVQENLHTYKPSQLYMERLKHIETVGMPPLPESELILKRDNESQDDHTHSDTDEDDIDPTSLKWTPLPSPNLDYHCKKPMVMLELDHGNNTDCMSREDTAEESFKIDDDFNCSFEDDREIDALVDRETKMENQIHSSRTWNPLQFARSDTTIHVADVRTERGSSGAINQPTPSADVRTEPGSSGAINQPTPSADVRTEPGSSGAINQPTPSAQSPHTIPSTDYTSNEAVTTPVDLYEIDDDLDISIDDIHRLDANVELYIQQSPDSSINSDELPPVDWTGTGRNVSAHDTMQGNSARVQWKPVHRTNTMSISSSRSRAGGSHGQLLSAGSGQESSSSAAMANYSGATNNSCLAVQACPMCNYQFPVGFSQLEADEHYAMCLSVEDLMD